MKLSFDFVSVFILFGIIQGLFFGLVVLNIKRGNRKANLLLSLFLFIVSFALLGGIFYKTNLYFVIPHLARFNEPFRLLIAPVLFFYFKELTFVNRKFGKFDILHLLPFLISMIMLIPFFIQSRQYKLNYISEQFLNKPDLYFSTNQIFLIIMIIQVLFYIVYIILMIKKHEKNIENSFSNIEKINLVWIKHFIFFYIILSIVIILLLLYTRLISHDNYMYRIIPIVVVIALYSIAYRGFVQPEIFRVISLDDNVKKFSLTTDKIDEYYKMLCIYMENQKPFLNEELTLPELAGLLGISVRYLSEVINTRSGYNFYYFINKYRIEEVKKLFVNTKGKDISVLDVAFEVGFNSKATFNAIFKYFTKMTPTQYKKSI